MRHDAKSSAERSLLLGRLKQHYEPAAGSPVLCLTSPTSDFDAQPPQYEWFASSGMGGADFFKANANDLTAAQELMESGQIAPAMPQKYWDVFYKPIKLLEDLNWGLTANGGIVLFELSTMPQSKDTVLPVGGNLVIREGGRYGTAVKEIQKRLEYGKAIKDALPVALNNNDPNKKDWVVYPIIFDQRMIELRKRQKEFNWE